MLHLKLFESFFKKYEDEINSSLEDITKRYEDEIKRYLHDISDEFPLTAKASKITVANTMKRFQCVIDFRINDIPKIREVVNQGLFDRIKEDYPNTNIEFGLRLNYPNDSGYRYYRDSVNAYGDYTNVEEIIKKIPSFLHTYQKEHRTHRGLEGHSLSIEVNIV